MEAREAGRPRWERFLPGVATLRRYDRSWLRGDVLAGVTVGAYLVPQVMAYAVIAGLPSVIGLWAVLVPLGLYAVLGSSRQLSIGPESTTAIMTAAGVGALVGAAGPSRYAEVAALMAIAVGIVCLVGWVARVGFLANLLSRPVLIGYLVGVAVLMVGSQLGKVTKLTIAGNDPLSQVRSLIAQAGVIHVPTLVSALVVLAALFVMQHWWPRAPGPLIALVGAAGIVAAFGLQRYGLATIGDVPAGLPGVRVPNVDGLALVALLPSALGIAVVGYSDNVLTARAFASKRGETIDSGQELLALGVINVANGFVQGFPVSSSSSRTVIGDATGARTQAHSLVALVCVIAVLAFAAPLLSSFPAAALGALVIYAATRLVDVAELRRLARFRRSELVLALVTAVMVVATGVLVGIGIAVALSILDLIRRISHPHDGVLGYVPGVAGMHDVDDYPEATQVPGLVVYRYDSPLFFANAEDFLTRALAVVEAADAPVRWFLLNAEANVEVDLTAVDTLDELRSRLAGQGVVFAMARVKQDLRDQLAAAGFIDAVGEGHVFATLPTAVAAFASWHRDTFGDLPPGLPPGLPMR